MDLNLKCDQLDKEYEKLCNILSLNIGLPNTPNPNKFTGNKEADSAIIQSLSDKDLENICVVNKYVYSLCQKENFWKNRVLNKFPELLNLGSVQELKTKFIPENTWKEYYLFLSSNVNKMVQLIDSEFYIDASNKGRLDIIYLLDIINQKIEDKLSAFKSTIAFFDAIANGHIDVVEHILKNHDVYRGNFNRIKKSTNFEDAAGFAAKNGHLEMLQFLANRKDEFKLDLDDETLHNLIMTSSYYGSVNVFNWLMNASPKYYSEALYQASNNNKPEIIESILKNPKVKIQKEDSKNIQYAAEKGSADVLKLLLDDPRFDPSYEKVEGYAMYDSARKNRIEIVRLLLKDKRITLKNCNFLRAALFNNNFEIAEMLINDPRTKFKCYSDLIDKEKYPEIYNFLSKRGFLLKRKQRKRVNVITLM